MSSHDRPLPFHRRLSNENLIEVRSAVCKPHYRREDVQMGVVHLGLGNFHRAHQAVYLESILNRGDLRWGICAVSLKRPVARDLLQAQDYLYTVLTRSAQATHGQVVGAIKESLVAPENPDAVVRRMADPHTKLITLTITEKGYLDQGEGSALDYLLKALTVRCRAQRPLSILSCDNLSSNGDRLYRQLIDAAHPLDPFLAQWIAKYVACPNTMVDRIVPATSDPDREETRVLLGLQDAWPVAAEPFSQWVIENRFAAERPDFESVGVQLVASCAPYEAMKLRLLNAAHSTLAYLGAPAGFKTVDQAIGCPEILSLIRRLWFEARATLPHELQSDVTEYLRALETRFANPAIGHRLEQIAMDGSLKIPVRLLATLRDCRVASLPSDAIVFALTAWLRWLTCVDESGATYELKDPMGNALSKLADSRQTAALRVRQVLKFEPVFGADLGNDPSLIDRMTKFLEWLEAEGSVSALKRSDFQVPQNVW